MVTLVVVGDHQVHASEPPRLNRPKNSDQAASDSESPIIKPRTSRYPSRLIPVARNGGNQGFPLTNHHLSHTFEAARRTAEAARMTVQA